MMTAAKTLKILAVGTFVGAVAFAAAGDAMAQKKIKWKMQSAWGTQVPNAGESGVRFVNSIKTMSDGKFAIKFFDPGALVPALETFDAASKGSIESAWTTPGYHAGRYPGLAFMTTVPFGPALTEFVSWKWFGGGNEIRDRVYAKHDLYAVDAFSHGAETSGWFKEPIKELSQLKGIKMRFFGMGAKVMQKVGVSTQLLAGADIYPALERGVIDATEYSMPTNDIKYGFYQIAKNNYFPGWHQQSSVSEFLMNKTKFEGLPAAYQEMIRSAAYTQIIYTHAAADAEQFGAMKIMQDKHGVTIHRWRDDQLAVFEKAWLEVVAEESAKDSLFKEFSESYFAFRNSFKLWGDAQAMKATYLD
jgi:TRAP-type mannitol/chloroaromatic compound transport system substrate-binding protein